MLESSASGTKILVEMTAQSRAMKPAEPRAQHFLEVQPIGF
jgi:hypothetical protein